MIHRAYYRTRSRVELIVLYIAWTLILFWDLFWDRVWNWTYITKGQQSRFAYH